MATEDVDLEPSVEPEPDIAASLVEESKEELELWPIVISAREAKLVDDVFVDNLMRQGLSANSNAANLSKFVDRIKEKELWFGRFLNILSIWPRYLPLAEKLSRRYSERVAEKRGINPSDSVKLLKILHKAIETSKRCKAELQDALERHGQVSVQHCVYVMGQAVDHLQLEVRSTEAQTRKVDDKPGLVERLKVLPSKADHVQSTHPPRATRDQSSSQSPVVRGERHKSRVKDNTTQHPERSQWGYSEVQVVHEVLKRNRGYLELKIPIDAIIPQLHAQDLLLDYEYAEVTSQPFPIKKNRSLIDAFLKKAPSIFYQFCSILEGQHGYEYIAHHLLREVRDLDPNIPLEDKMKTFGITWSPGPKRSGPPSKDIPKTVDALVDGDRLKKSMQSIIDKQMEMAEDVKRVHQMEVSQLKETVSETKDKVDVVKAECTALVQQIEQGKVDSSGHVSALQGKIQEIIQACEDVQTQKSADEDSSVETLLRAMNLERRIGQLTTALEEKERELQIWKGAAERREEMLLESRSNYGDLEREHKELRNSKEKEIESLQNKWETSQARTAAVTKKLSASQERYKSLVTGHEELSHQHEELTHQHGELTHQHGELTHQHEELTHQHGELSQQHGELTHQHEELTHQHGELTHQHGELTHQHEELTHQHGELTHQHEELTHQHEELTHQHADHVAKYEEMKENSGKKIKKFESELERMSKENSELRLLVEKKGQNKSEPNEENRMSTTSKNDSQRSSQRSQRSQGSFREFFSMLGGGMEKFEEMMRRMEGLGEESREEELSSLEESELSGELESESEESEEESESEESEEESEESEESFSEESFSFSEFSFEERGYYEPRELNQVDADKELQKKATNGEHLVWKEGQGNLKLGVWQDGTCSHLQIHQKQDEASRVSYSLDEKVYFDSIRELCNHYMIELLPGYRFKLRW